METRRQQAVTARIRNVFEPATTLAYERTSATVDVYPELLGRIHVGANGGLTWGLDGHGCWSGVKTTREPWGSRGSHATIEAEMSGPFPDVIVQINADGPKVMFCCRHFHSAEKIVIQYPNWKVIAAFDVLNVIPEIERFSSDTTAGLEWQDQLVCCLVKIPGDTLLVGNPWWGSRFAISLTHCVPVLTELWEDEILLAERNLVLQALVAYDQDPRHSELHRRLETQADALYESVGLIRLAGDLQLFELIPCLRSIESWSRLEYSPIRRVTQIALRKLGQSPRLPCTKLPEKPVFECDPDSFATIRKKVLDIRPGANFDEIYDRLGPPDRYRTIQNHAWYQYDVEDDIAVTAVLFANLVNGTIERVKHYRPPLWSGPNIFSRVGLSICDVNDARLEDVDSKYLGTCTEVFYDESNPLAFSMDIVPSTVRQAAELIATSVLAKERQRVTASEPSEQFGLGLCIRNGWSLSDDDTPLKRDAMRYGIAHADDISGLINAWAFALVRGVEFDPVAHCVQYHEHWARLGKTSLEAGGWKDG